LGTVAFPFSALHYREIQKSLSHPTLAQRGATAYNSADNVTWLLDCSMRGGRESEVPVRELKSLLAWRLAIDESSDE
jgi:hypothetical protein